MTAADWLPPDRAPARELRHLWRPPTLGRLALDGFVYVVVDEIEGNALGLALSEWPRVDQSGRIRFSTGALMLGADRATFERFLARHREPRELAERPLRVGDVFAVRPLSHALAAVRDELEQQRRLEPFLDPGDWIRPPVYDITADAREAAKSSFYAAVTPKLEPGQARELAELTDSESL